MAKIVLTIDGTVLKQVLLQKNRVTIGRRSTNDLVINHVAVSAEHAVVIAQGADFFLEDLNSTNGTLVNGRTIDKVVLHDNDVIDIAPYQIKFEVRSSAGSLGTLGKKPVVEELPDDIENLDGHTMLQQFALLRVLDGPAAGQEMALTKPVTTFGRPGVQVAVLTQRKQAYFISHVEGDTSPLVNGISIGQNARMLRYDDVIDLSGTKIVFARDE
ncbi:MAG TPA: FHA domain-containing protein [Burkholderiaceae bacterium]|jgi:pSer/pThr/pTyr-binding forkhead associated (FHA) protein